MFVEEIMERTKFPVVLANSGKLLNYDLLVKYEKTEVKSITIIDGYKIGIEFWEDEVE